MGDNSPSVSAVSMFKSTNVHAVKPEAEKPQEEEQKKPYINSVWTASAYMN